MRISYSLKYLLGLFALCLMAFFGFGAVFKELGISFGIEAATAAFGALFIIFSTKFLMEKENESERKQFVFQQNVNQYRELAELQMNILAILKSRKVNSNEKDKLKAEHALLLMKIDELKAKHALLLITGSDVAVKASGEFLDLCINASQKNSEEINNSEEIIEDDQTDLWGAATNYFFEARAGLYLPNDNIDKVKTKKTFLESVKNFEEARARPEVELEVYIKNKKIIKSYQIPLKRFIDKIKDIKFEPKIAKTQISIYPYGYKNKPGHVIGYIQGCKQSSISFETPAIESSQALKKIEEYLIDQGLDAEVEIIGETNGRDKGKYKIKALLPFSMLDTTKGLNTILHMLKECQSLRSN